MPRRGKRGGAKGRKKGRGGLQRLRFLDYALRRQERAGDGLEEEAKRRALGPRTHITLKQQRIIEKIFLLVIEASDGPTDARKATHRRAEKREIGRKQTVSDLDSHFLKKARSRNRSRKGGNKEGEL